MSNEITQEQMEKIATVQNILVEDYRIPAFEQRCEELGIKFASAEDRDAAIETVAMLRIKEAKLREQGIDPNPTSVKVARDMLKQAMAGDIQQIQQPVEKQASEYSGSRLSDALETLAG
jgi:hypothetical protein